MKFRYFIFTLLFFCILPLNSLSKPFRHNIVSLETKVGGDDNEMYYDAKTNLELSRCKEDYNLFKKLGYESNTAELGPACNQTDSYAGSCWVEPLSFNGGKYQVRVCYHKSLGYAQCKDLTAGEQSGGFYVIPQDFSETKTGYQGGYSDDSDKDCPDISSDVNALGYNYIYEATDPTYNSDIDKDFLNTYCQQVAESFNPNNCEIPSVCPCGEECKKNNFIPPKSSNVWKKASQMVKSCYVCLQKYRAAHFYCRKVYKCLNKYRYKSEIYNLAMDPSRRQYLKSIHGKGFYLCGYYNGTLCGCAKAKLAAGPRHFPRVVNKVDESICHTNSNLKDNPQCNLFETGVKVRQFRNEIISNPNATCQDDKLKKAEFGYKMRGTFFSPKLFVVSGTNERLLSFNSKIFDEVNADFFYNQPICETNECQDNNTYGLPTSKKLVFGNFYPVIFEVGNSYRSLDENQNCINKPSGGLNYVMLRLEYNVATNESALVAYRVRFVNAVPGTLVNDKKVLADGTITKFVSRNEELKEAIKNAKNEMVEVASTTQFTYSPDPDPNFVHQDIAVKGEYLMFDNIGKVKRPPLKYSYDEGSTFINSPLKLEADRDAIALATDVKATPLKISLSPGSLISFPTDEFDDDMKLPSVTRNIKIAGFNKDVYDLEHGITSSANAPTSDSAILYLRRFSVGYSNPCVYLKDLSQDYLYTNIPSSINDCRAAGLSNSQLLECYTSFALYSECQGYMGCMSDKTSISGCQSEDRSPMIKLSGSDSNVVEYQKNTEFRSKSFICINDGFQFADKTSKLSNTLLYGDFGDPKYDYTVRWKKNEKGSFAMTPGKALTISIPIAVPKPENEEYKPQHVINLNDAYFTGYQVDRTKNMLGALKMSTMLNANGRPGTTSAYDYYASDCDANEKVCEDKFEVKHRLIHEANSNLCTEASSFNGGKWSLEPRDLGIDYHVYVPLRCQFVSFSGSGAGGAGFTTDGKGWKGGKTDESYAANCLANWHTPFWSTGLIMGFIFFIPFPCVFPGAAYWNIPKYDSTGSTGFSANAVIDLMKLPIFDGYLNVVIGTRTQHVKYKTLRKDDSTQCFMGPSDGDYVKNNRGAWDSRGGSHKYWKCSAEDCSDTIDRDRFCSKRDYSSRPSIWSNDDDTKYPCLEYRDSATYSESDIKTTQVFADMRKGNTEVGFDNHKAEPNTIDYAAEYKKEKTKALNDIPTYEAAMNSTIAKIYNARMADYYFAHLNNLAQRLYIADNALHLIKEKVEDKLREKYQKLAEEEKAKADEAKEKIEKMNALIPLLEKRDEVERKKQEALDKQQQCKETCKNDCITDCSDKCDETCPSGDTEGDGSSENTEGDGSSENVEGDGSSGNVEGSGDNECKTACKNDCISNCNNREECDQQCPLDAVEEMSDEEKQSMKDKALELNYNENVDTNIVKNDKDIEQDKYDTAMAKYRLYLKIIEDEDYPKDEIKETEIPYSELDGFVGKLNAFKKKEKQAWTKVNNMLQTNSYNYEAYHEDNEESFLYQFYAELVPQTPPASAPTAAGTSQEITDYSKIDICLTGSDPQNSITYRNKLKDLYNSMRTEINKATEKKKEIINGMITWSQQDNYKIPDIETILSEIETDYEDNNAELSELNIDTKSSALNLYIVQKNYKDLFVGDTPTNDSDVLYNLYQQCKSHRNDVVNSLATENDNYYKKFKLEHINNYNPLATSYVGLMDIDIPFYEDEFQKDDDESCKTNILASSIKEVYGASNGSIDRVCYRRFKDGDGNDDAEKCTEGTDNCQCSDVKTVNRQKPTYKLNDEDINLKLQESFNNIMDTLSKACQYAALAANESTYDNSGSTSYVSIVTAARGSSPIDCRVEKMGCTSKGGICPCFDNDNTIEGVYYSGICVKRNYSGDGDHWYAACHNDKKVTQYTGDGMYFRKLVMDRIKNKDYRELSNVVNDKYLYSSSSNTSSYGCYMADDPKKKCTIASAYDDGDLGSLPASWGRQGENSQNSIGSLIGHWNVYETKEGAAGGFKHRQGAGGGGPGSMALALDTPIEQEYVNGAYYPILNENGTKRVSKATSAIKDMRCIIKCPIVFVVVKQFSLYFDEIQDNANVDMLCEYSGDPEDDMEPRANTYHNPKKCYIMTETVKGIGPVKGRIISPLDGVCPIAKCPYGTWNDTSERTSTGTEVAGSSQIVFDRKMGLCKPTNKYGNETKSSWYFNMAFDKNVYTALSFKGSRNSPLEASIMQTTTEKDPKTGKEKKKNALKSYKIAECTTTASKAFQSDKYGQLENSPELALFCNKNGFWQKVNPKLSTSVGKVGNYPTNLYPNVDTNDDTRASDYNRNNENMNIVEYLVRDTRYSLGQKGDMVFSIETTTDTTGNQLYDNAMSQLSQAFGIKIKKPVKKTTGNKAIDDYLSSIGQSYFGRILFKDLIKCPMIDSDTYDYDEDYSGNAMWDFADEGTEVMSTGCNSKSIQSGAGLPTRRCNLNGRWGPVVNKCLKSCKSELKNGVVWEVLPENLRNLGNKTEIEISGACSGKYLNSQNYREASGTIKRSCNLLTGTWGDIDGDSVCNDSIIRIEDNYKNIYVATPFTRVVNYDYGNTYQQIVDDIDKGEYDVEKKTKYFSPLYLTFLTNKFDSKDFDQYSFYQTNKDDTDVYVNVSYKELDITKENKSQYAYDPDGNFILEGQEDIDAHYIILNIKNGISPAPYSYMLAQGNEERNEFLNVQNWFSTIFDDNMNFTAQWAWKANLNRLRSKGVFNATRSETQELFRNTELVVFIKNYKNNKALNLKNIALFSPYLAKKYAQNNNLSYNFKDSQSIRFRYPIGVSLAEYPMIVYNGITGGYRLYRFEWDKGDNKDWGERDDKSIHKMGKSCHGKYYGTIDHNTTKHIMYTPDPAYDIQTFASIYCYDGRIFGYHAFQTKIVQDSSLTDNNTKKILLSTTKNGDTEPNDVYYQKMQEYQQIETDTGYEFFTDRNTMKCGENDYSCGGPKNAYIFGMMSKYFSKHILPEPEVQEVFMNNFDAEKDTHYTIAEDKDVKKVLENYAKGSEGYYYRIVERPSEWIIGNNDKSSKIGNIYDIIDDE